MYSENASKAQKECANGVPSHLESPFAWKDRNHEKLRDLSGLSVLVARLELARADKAPRILRSVGEDLSTETDVDNFLDRNVQALENAALASQNTILPDANTNCSKNNQTARKSRPSVPMVCQEGKDSFRPTSEKTLGGLRA